jgi:DsbC/DsbD-like thiol-disulfide interchange protein
MDLGSRDFRPNPAYPACVPRRHHLVVPGLLAWIALLACTTREPAFSDSHHEPELPPERGPLVTVELAVVDEAARERLAARLGPDSAVAQADVLLAVHHHIVDGWHIYWKNPGESGLRTRIDVEAKHASAGEALFPGPDRFVASGAVTYGWGHEAVLFVPLDQVGDAAEVKVHSHWLACAESCIPGEAHLDGKVAELPRRDDAITQAMLERVPEPAGQRIVASWQDGALRLRPASESVQLTELFPYASDTALLGRQVQDAGGLELHYRFTGPPPEAPQGVLLANVDGTTRWLELAVAWP